MEEKILTYEEAISKLETILNELENDESTLEETLEKFKNGIELYNFCSNKLKAAEGEVKVLLEEDDDSALEYDFLKETDDEYY